MGLDTSHNCWHGSYTSFHRWRADIARVAGINLDLMEGFTDNGKPGILWKSLKADVLHVLLHHSDCDGHINWRYTKKLADRLAELLPLLPEDSNDFGYGHRARTQQFINGLLSAYEAHERVEFH